MKDAAMHVELLTEQEIPSIYTYYMIRDFPENELKPLSVIVSSIRHGQLLPFGLIKNRVLLGYAFYVKARNASVGSFVNADSSSGKVSGIGYLCDYIAIVPSERGKGFGTTFQKMLYEKELTDGDFLLCEVERADKAVNQQKYTECEERRKRKIHHHIKVGWRETGVNVCTFGVEYQLLEYPLKGIFHDKETVRKWYWDIYSMLLPEDVCREKVIFNFPQ
ncbi:MAG: hypothetical protein IJG30_00795 [Synergistaceae bacterium]|nr:hypothetical protein [Synergistaceae bacterium]